MIIFSPPMSKSFTGPVEEITGKKIYIDRQGPTNVHCRLDWTHERSWARATPVARSAGLHVATQFIISITLA